MNFIKVTFCDKEGNNTQIGAKNIDRLDCIIQGENYTKLMDQDCTSCIIKESANDVINTLINLGFNVQKIVSKKEYN